MTIVDEQTSSGGEKYVLKMTKFINTSMLPVLG
jgi:hypothetical protein